MAMHLKYPNFTPAEERRITEAILRFKVTDDKESLKELVSVIYEFWVEAVERFARKLPSKFRVDEKDFVLEVFVNFHKQSITGRFVQVNTPRDLHLFFNEVIQKTLKIQLSSNNKRAISSCITNILSRNCSHNIGALVSQSAETSLIAQEELQRLLKSLKESAAIIQDNGRRHAPKTTPLATKLFEIDSVDCTVFAPPQACVGASLMVQVITHTPLQKAQARRLATEFDEDTQRRGFTSLETEVERGSQLLFHLTMPGLTINQCVRSLIWRGDPACVQFGVNVPLDYSANTVVGTVTVSQQQVPLGQIMFKLKIHPQKKAFLLPAEPTGTARIFELFFISYASEDRDEVLKRVQMFKSLGKRFFQDLLHLDPGDRWRQKLYAHIDDCDAVILFWSSNAKKSEWVMRECRYAIENKGLDHLLPVIIEGPPPVDPPPLLEDLHMDDYLLHIMKSGPSPDQ